MLEASWADVDAGDPSGADPHRVWVGFGADERLEGRQSPKRKI
jgi:hypothetical protein